MKKFIILSSILLVILIAAPHAWGKDIVQNAQTLKGNNKAYIRVDGLACYFCSYGLERFFRQSGKVAAYDTDMKKGVVEIIFMKDKPLLTVSELNQIVDDAGYTPRETSYELVGRFEKSEGKYFFHVDGQQQRLPLKSVSALPQNLPELIGKTVMLKTKAEKYLENSMLLDPVSIEEQN